MMQMQKRQKMCWNCEGAVSPDVLYCPYCGSDMQASHEPSDLSQETSNLSALYTPPYVPSHKGFGVPAFQEEKESEEDFYSGNTVEEKEVSEASIAKEDMGLWPLLFLSMGTQLLTLGLLLFFFSDRGRLILEWNSYYWFVYCILSCPLLVFGWKLLQSRKG